MTAFRDSSNISVEDGTATVRGWAQDVRNLGGISFLTLRDRFGTIQVTMPKKKIDPELFGMLTTLSRETVVSVTGEVKESNQTALGLELIPPSAEVLSEAAVPLPLGVVDKVNAEMDTRLNNRFMDLRKPEVKAIFELKSLMLELIQEAVRGNGFTQVQTPKITNEGETITVSEAALVLSFNGEEVGSEKLTLTESETAGSYTLTLTNVSFDVSEMENDQQLILTLNVTLSNGQSLSAAGGTFYYNDGELLTAVG